MKTLCNELEEIKHKAFDIGIQLGIPRRKLKEFKEEGNFLSGALDFWLSGNVPDVPLTWNSIVAALESESINEGGCAKKILKKYCCDKDVKGNDH